MPRASSALIVSTGGSQCSLVCRNRWRALVYCAEASSARCTVSPSALLTARASASSMMPFFRPCNSSPAPGSRSTRKKSTMEATATSDCPTPTVSTRTTSYPAASHTIIASRVRRVTPPSEPAAGLGRMKASGAAASRGMRVLSPRMLPPERALDGSTARTATRLPRPSRWSPKASMKVLLPTPGTPLTPTRVACPASGRRSSSRRCAASWWSARTLSTSVIAFASARRSRARTAAASASTSTFGGAPAEPLGSDGIRRLPSRFERLPDEREDAASCRGNRGARAEDRLHARPLEEFVVLRWNDPADRDHDVARTEPLELPDHLRDERLVTARLRGHADHVDVVLDRLARDFLGRLEERAHVDVEAQIGERGGDHLGAAVVTILADLGDQDARAAAVVAQEAIDLLPHRGPLGIVAEVTAIDTRDGPDLGLVAPPHLLERLRDLAHRGARARRLHREPEKIPLPGLGAALERRQGLLDLPCVARAANPPEARHLRLAHGRVVDLAGVDLGLLGKTVLVHADDDVLATVDTRLPARCRLLDAQLRHAGLDGLGHAPRALHVFDDAERLGRQRVRQRLHEVRAAPRVDHLRDAGLELQDQLRVAGHAGGRVGRQRDRLVERVGVQALRTAEDGGHPLDGGADDVVERILLREAGARGLAVRAEHQRLDLLGREVLPHERGPEQARRPQLRHLHVEAHADGEEERQPAREGVDVEPLGERRTHVLEAVRDGERQLQVARRPGLLHVVPGDRDRVEARHLLRGVLDDVRDDPHRGSWRVDVGVADHELLQDVVLDGPRQLRPRDALLLPGDDEARQDREHGTVHGHRHRHLVEWHAVEEDLHVLDGIDGDARLADVPDDARVIAVVAAVGGGVEGDRQSHLSGGEVGPVEGVRLLRGGEPRVLPDGPRLLGIHGRARPAEEGKVARNGIQEVERGDVGARIERLDLEAFGRPPDQVVRVRAFALLARKLEPAAQVRSIGGLRHDRRTLTLSPSRSKTAAGPLADDAVREPYSEPCERSAEPTRPTGTVRISTSSDNAFAPSRSKTA